MAKKIFPKALSVGLSLALCAGMVAPAFAATFGELNEAISSEKDGTFGANEDIIASTGDDGVRNVELRDDVIYAGEDDDTTISVRENVTIDLNGNNIDAGYKEGGSEGSKDSVITVTDGADLTIKDSTAEWTTTTDEEGNEVKTDLTSGQITGGNTNGGNGAAGGIAVRGGVTLNLDSVTVTGNKAYATGGGIYAGDGTTVNIKNSMISENTADQGGGIYAEDRKNWDNTPGAQVTITDSVIKENTAENKGSAQGGGVAAKGEGTTVTMTNTDVVGNTVNQKGNSLNTGGGGIFVMNGAEVEMIGGSVSGNQTTGSTASGGGVALTQDTNYKGDPSSFTANGTVIENNTAGQYGGGIYGNTGTVDLTDVDIIGNTANRGQGGGIYGGKVTISGGEITDNTATSETQNALGGGVYTNNFTMTGKTLIYGNHLDGNKFSYGTDIYFAAGGNGKLVLYDVTEEDGLTLDGKPITGWRFEGSGNTWSEDRGEDNKVYIYYDRVNKKYVYAYGNDELAKFTEFAEVGEDGSITISNWSGNLGLIAAHDKYFNIDVENADGTESNYDNILVERNHDLNGEDILSRFERDGYTLESWTLTDSQGNVLEEFPEKMTDDMTLTLTWAADPAPVIPGGGGDTDITIDEPAVPLASGPVTRAQFVNYLYVRQGSPETELSDFADVSKDHEYALAIGWAQSIGLISGDEDNNFYPDELVTVSNVRDFLGSYAKVIAAGAVEADSLSSLTGEDDEAVLNCDEVLAEFFGEEYIPAGDEDEAA